jgi:gas vesicle protein
VSKKGKFGIGLLLGAAVGAVAGILTAPKSGKETREDLKKKGKEVAEVVKEKTGEVVENTGKAVDEAKVKVDAFKQEASVKTGEVVENIKTEAEKVQKRALNTVEGAKKGFEKKV